MRSKSCLGFTQHLLMGLVRAYRFFLSPWLGVSCRFEPSCSAYALQALSQHGAAVGSYLIAARLIRCHPFCAGGHDPVPCAAPRLFSHWRCGPTDPSPLPQKDGL